MLDATITPKVYHFFVVQRMCLVASQVILLKKCCRFRACVPVRRLHCSLYLFFTLFWEDIGLTLVKTKHLHTFQSNNPTPNTTNLGHFRNTYLSIRLQLGLTRVTAPIRVTFRVTGQS